MKKSWIIFLCAAMIAGGLVFAGCSLRSAGEPEVRNSGTAIQWKRSNETEWHDLVSLSDLMGAAGQDGKDGADGVNGKDGADGVNGKDGANGMNGQNGADGKAIEVRKSQGAVQWRYEGGQWQDLVALADITGPAGMNGEKGEAGQAGTNGKNPEFRVENGTLQWRYTGEAVWLNLYDLTTLKGADGSDGKDGADGTDGVGISKTEINASGELLITYTSGVTVNLGKVVGADGRDGIDGTNGTDGKDGADGTDGKDGACPGYFYATGYANESIVSLPLSMDEKVNSGGLISYDAANRTITLKKGHTYNVCLSGSIGISSNDKSSKKSFNMGIWLEDGYQSDIAKKATFTHEYNESNKYVSIRVPLTYSRFYVADSQDIVLKYKFGKEFSWTYLDHFNYHLTITALN